MDAFKIIESYIDWYLKAFLKMLLTPRDYLLSQYESDNASLTKPIIFLLASSLFGSLLLKSIPSASTPSDIEDTIFISILWVIGLSSCVWISFYIVRVKISFLSALSSMCYTLGVIGFVSALILSFGYGFIVITHPNTIHIVDKYLVGDPLRIAPVSEIEDFIGQYKQELDMLKNNSNKNQYTILKENIADSAAKIILLDKKLKEEKNRAEAIGITEYEPDKKIIKELGDEYVRFMENLTQAQLHILMNLSVFSSILLLIGGFIMCLSIIPLIAYTIIYWRMFKQKYVVNTSKSCISFGVFVLCIYPMLLLKLSVESVLL